MINEQHHRYNLRSSKFKNLSSSLPQIAVLFDSVHNEVLCNRSAGFQNSKSTQNLKIQECSEHNFVSEANDTLEYNDSVWSDIMGTTFIQFCVIDPVEPIPISLASRMPAL